MFLMEGLWALYGLQWIFPWPAALLLGIIGGPVVTYQACRYLSGREQS